MQGRAGGDHGVHGGLLGDGLTLQMLPLKL